jgi:hypothetical protein
MGVTLPAGNANRRRWRIGAFVAVFACAALIPAIALAAAAPARDISGVWWGVKYSPKAEIQGGGEIPYNDRGKAEYARIMAGLKDGSIKDEARRLCTPDGLPRILGNPYPFKVVQTRGQTTFLYELNRVFRVVLMDTPQESEEALIIAPYYSGHSVGRWDGDTLVAETAGFNEKTWIDATGAPHSDQMTVVERYRRIGDRQLEVVATITDPYYLTRPFSVRHTYELHPEVQLQTDYICGEPHRDISHIPGVQEARRARGQ